MKLGLLTAAFRGPVARRGRRVGGSQRLRDARGRVLAGRPAASSAATRASRTSTSTRSTPTRCTRRSSATASRSRRSPTTRTTSHPDDAHRERGQRAPAQGRSTRRRRSASASSARSSATTRTGRCRRTSSASARSGPRSSRYAGERDVKIAIENCPMIFSYDEWPGGNNLAWSPAIWDEMFSAIPDANFGLNLDPSHLVWLQIDYERAVYDFADRIFHAHAKDLEIRARRALPPRDASRPGSAGRCRACPASARSTGGASSPRSTRSATTTSSRSSTRTAASRATQELVERGFLIARDTLAPLIH